MTVSLIRNRLCARVWVPIIVPGLDEPAIILSFEKGTASGPGRPVVARRSGRLPGSAASCGLSSGELARAGDRHGDGAVLRCRWPDVWSERGADRALRPTP